MAPIIYLTNDTTPSNICNPLNDNLFLEVTIKSYKTCKLEDVIIILLLELVAPMPSGCQPSIDARTSIKEIVCTTPIECMPEAVHQNDLAAGLNRTKCIVNVLTNVMVPVEFWYLV